MLNVLDLSWNILVLQRRKRTILILQGKSISFPTRRIVIMFYPRQRETVVLESMSFEALSCKGGTSISICTSRALILRVLVWHLLGSTTVIVLPCMLTRGGTRLPTDSHIRHFVLATSETTVTQQVSYRPIKCQSRLWPSRVTTVNASHKM